MKKVYLNTLTPEEIIKRLKNGEVVKYISEGDDIREIRLVDGILVKEYPERGKAVFDICGGIFIDEYNDYYFEEQEEFKVEKTGLYKTRDGRTAYVGFIYSTDGVRGFIEGDQHDTEWSKNGHYCGDCDGYDLVEYVGD